MPGQTAAPGSLLVQLQPGVVPEQLSEKFSRTDICQGWAFDARISEMLDVWQLRYFAGGASRDAAMFSWLSRQPEVRIVQYDHVLDARVLEAASPWPDDPLIGAQWQYANTGQSGGTTGADLSAEDAWAITTGGLTPSGDTIVVAVIDGGVAPHPDLLANMWYNYGDLPGDGIDNDGNGYVDDFRGWNVYTQNDSISGIAIGHGTPITGIIGARGNNGQGVSGVNWTVKNMFVAGKGQESVVLAAFDYVWKARRRYNISGGSEGALVVALNCSWGVDYGQAADAPLWCAAFDKLGEEGIITVAATANLDVNVDVVGDLPTTCPSNYLISVTSLDHKDQKAQGAAWGATHIDLGAYGEQVYTLSGQSGYGYQEGTSFASPHVAGAVALLYAAPCTHLSELAYIAPEVAASRVRQLLLEQVIPIASMDGITATGGRLDLFELLAGYEEQCVDCPPPFEPQAVVVGRDSARLYWTSLPGMVSVSLRWRKAGDPSWNLLPGVTAPLFLPGLSPCTDYEFSVRANCQGGQGSLWSAPVSFRTEGCCMPPDVLEVLSQSEQGAVIQWSQVAASLGYRLWIRPEGGIDWVYVEQDSNAYHFTGLQSCTLYEVKVQSRCDTGFTDFSAVLVFRTSGCGACLDVDYCQAAAGQAQEEWIASISIGNWQHSSGGILGYEDFTGSEGAVLTLVPGDSLQVTLTPGYAGWAYKEYFRIYIDYNGDGDFEDSGELAFEPGFAVSESVTGVLVVPDYLGNGWTRMRVMMKFKGLFNNPPEPCETFEFGQVEDYCVQMNADPVRQTDPSIAEEREIEVFPQPAADYVYLRLPAGETRWVQLSVSDLSGRQLITQRLPVDVNGLIRISTGVLPEGLYLLHLVDDGRYFKQKLLVQRAR